MVQTLQAFLCKVITTAIASMVIFCFGVAQTHGQQIWTYDFGDATGTFASGDEINPALLPPTQTDGGDTRLRIGGGNEIILSNTDNDIGTFSRMIFEASPTGGLNNFVIGNFDADNILYFRSTISLSAVEQGENDLFLLFNTEDALTSNTLDNASNIGGLRFRIQDEEDRVNVQRRRNGVWQETFSFGDGLIDLDEAVTVELYLNNSDSSRNYYRNGELFVLNTGFYAIYLNNERIAGSSGSGDSDLNRTDLEGQAISVIRFQGGATNGDKAQIEIDDIVYSNSLPDLRTVEGTAGWRMLASPYDGFNVEQLARQNLVQGVTGGNDFYDDGKDYDDAATNLYYYLDTTEDTWQEFDNFNSNISTGQGFIWYMFDNDDFNSVSLPFTLYASGTSPSADVTIPMNPDDDFTLIGNPYSVNLDASDVSSWGNLQATAYTWDPDAGTEGEYVHTTATTSPFTGFFVEKSEEGTGDITIPLTEASPKQMDSEIFKISLNLKGENKNNVVTQDNSTSILFRQGATHEWDIYDATKLVPLLSSYATVGIVGDRVGEERIKSIDSRPIDFSGELELKLALNVHNFGGEFQLYAEFIDVPEEWSLFLNDYETGETVDLRQTAYSFNYNNSSQKIVEVEHKMPETFVMSSEEADERFTLTIEAGEAVSIPAPDELPQKLSLSQNYPNPFNPVTVIHFDIPQQSHVRLAVYDLLGRQVDVLVNDTRERGSYDVTWDASRFSSGVYFYHLETDGQTLTRRMTLIK